MVSSALIGNLGKRFAGSRKRPFALWLTIAIAMLLALAVIVAANAGGRKQLLDLSINSDDLVRMFEFSSTKELDTPAARAYDVPKKYHGATTPNELFDKIYIINLDACKVRMDTMQRYADAANVTVTRFPAVDGATLNLLHPPDGMTMEKLEHKNVVQGILGANVSHRRIFKDVIDNNYSLALILEDDVFPQNSTWRELPELIKTIDYAAQAKQRDWHLIFLRRTAFRSVADEETWAMSPSGHPITVAQPSWGTAAYIVNYEGAKRLYEDFQEYRQPCDVQLASYIRNNKDFVALSACHNDKFTNKCPEMVLQESFHLKGCAMRGTQTGRGMTREQIHDYFARQKPKQERVRS